MNDEQPSREQLLEERDKLDALLTGLATADIGIDVVGVDYKIVFQNEPMQRRFGDSVGRLCYETYMGLEEPCEQCPMVKAIKSGKAERVEVTARDGRHYELLSGAYVNSGGTVDKVIEVVRDITERKQAEEALAASKEQWRSLVENAPNLVLTVDHDGRILFINRTLSEDSREEVLGRLIYEFTPKSYHEAMKACIERVFQAGEAATFESKSLDEYGPLWFTNRVGPVQRDGHVVAVTIVSTDVTERKQMEDALREAHDHLEERVERRTAELATANTRLKEEVEERKRAEEARGDAEEQFRTLFESTHDAVMLLDEQAFFECNDATLRVFGCSTREEFVGKHPSELSPPMQPDGTDSQTAAKAKIALAIKTGRAQFEWLHCRADGFEFFADVLLSSMELRGKTVLQAVVRDISERKRTEQAVLREQDKLRRLLESSDRERRLTACEIHDGVTQHIAAAKMQLEAASQWKDENPEAAAQAYERGLELLSQGMGEARRLISGLRPPILDEAGVVAAIEHLTCDPSMQERPEVSFVFNAKFGRLAPLLENAIFRIVQESVTNACRYSESSKVQVRLTQQESRIQRPNLRLRCRFDSSAASI